METSAAPGWYADPTGRHDYRYWSGDEWTGQVADGEAADDARAVASADAGPAPGDAAAVGPDPARGVTAPRIAISRSAARPDDRAAAGPRTVRPDDRTAGATRPDDDAGEDDDGDDVGDGYSGVDDAYHAYEEGPLVDPAEALAEATLAGTLLPARVPPPKPARRRPKRRLGRGVLTVLGGALAGALVGGAVWFLVIEPEDTAKAPAGADSSGDPLLDALVDYVAVSSRGALTDADAVCMAESIVGDVGRDRLLEVGVADGADPLVALSPEEVRTGLPRAAECLDDQGVEALIAATLKPSVLERLAAQSPECLARGWMDGLGRAPLVDLYALWASGAGEELTSMLTPEQLGVLGDVIARCNADSAAGD